nr:oligopeptide/dipeptide ABC transporter ATP-binding protein [uncultured Cetobacterium sp.]
MGINLADEKLLEIKNLKKEFMVNGTPLKAVNDVSFYIKKGETLGLVGESGCGKTTCGRTILGIYPPTAGEVYYNNRRVDELNSKERLDLKKKMQIIFQDPYASLNPRMTVGDIIGEGIDIFNLYQGEERRARIGELLDLVGLNKEHINRFPHEFSGGQRQRIGIARALAINPEFIVCDEPISALDVSIQAQIVNLLIKLQRELKLTYLFIAHDLSMVRHISDRVGVMYLGKIVEIGSAQELYTNPKHPYTKALMSAVPVPDPDYKSQQIELKGEIPSPLNPPSGCAFRTRCPLSAEICAKETPSLIEIDKDYSCACHFVK